MKRKPHSLPPRGGDSIQRDMNTRSIPITNIKASQLAFSVAANDGTEVGRYGHSKYGRCIYGKGPRGIYGTDTYGNCRYW